MTDSKINEIQDIVADVDEHLRQRLKLDVQVDHVILAIAPDGAGIVGSNVGPAGLSDMAELLAEIADETAKTRRDNEPLN